MAYKTAYSFFSFDGGLKDVSPHLEAIKAAGYDGVEFVLTEDGALNLSSSDAEITALLKRTQDAGLEVSSVGCFLHWGVPITASDASVRKRAMDIVRRQLEAAALLKADTILLVPGYVGNEFAENSEIVPYDIAYERALEGVKELCEHAAKTRVSIGVENVWNKFLLSPLEFRSFIDAVDSPWCGAYFDVGNIIYIGYPEQWIRILGERIKKIHFCDYKFDGFGLSAFCDLLEGDVDFCAVMAALREAGYEGFITLEMLPNYKKHPLRSVHSNKPSLDYILSL